MKIKIKSGDLEKILNVDCSELKLEMLNLKTLLHIVKMAAPSLLSCKTDNVAIFKRNGSLFNTDTKTRVNTYVVTVDEMEGEIIPLKIGIVLVGSLIVEEELTLKIVSIVKQENLISADEMRFINII